jgi:hypothetical protein
MSETEASLHVLHRVLLVLLVCLALCLVGCSGDPECFAVPFLPKCFEDDDDDEEQPNDTATQASAIGSRPFPRDLSSWLREGLALAPEHGPQPPRRQPRGHRKGERGMLGYA